MHRLLAAALLALAPALWLAPERSAQAAEASGPALAPAQQASAGPADDDPLAAALAAEYALQAGKLEDATRWFLQAAEGMPGDAALAERAARVALLAKDDVRAAAALKLWRARAGDTVAMRAAEAALALRQGDARRGTRLLRGLLLENVDDPGEEGWRYALRALDAASGDPEAAGRVLRAVVAPRRMPDDLAAWLAFADFAERLRRDDIVEDIVREVIARYPDEPATSLLQANQAREAGKPEQARAALARLERRPDLDERLELKIAIAREYVELGDRARAEALLAGGPQNDRLYAIRAAFLAQAEDKDGIARLYDELRKVSSTPAPARRLLLGQIAEFIDRSEEALEWYAGVPGGEQRRIARLRIPGVLHKLGRGEEAYARLRELQSDAALDETTRRDAYLFEAELYKQDRRDEAEVETYARALAAYPDEPALLYARALMWERRDDIARAEADFRRILAIDPDDTNALNALGYTLADRTDRYQEALELIARALNAEPDNAAIIDSYGWVLYRLGRHKEALTELRRAFTKQKDAEIAAHVAEVLWVMGKREEAMTYFEESRRIDPESRSLQRALEQTGAVLPPLPPKPELARPTAAGAGATGATAAQAGPAQGEPGSTEPVRTGPSQTSPSQTSPSQTSPSQTSPSQTSPSQTSPSQTSPSQTGPSQTGPSQTGPSQTGPSQTSSADVETDSPPAGMAEPTP